MDPNPGWRAYLPSRQALEVSTHEEMKEYLHQLIFAHGERVEQFKMLLACTAKEVTDSIILAMEEVWNKVSTGSYNQPEKSEVTLIT